MTFLTMLHVFLVGIWGGLVLAETVIELALTGEHGRAQAARAHLWIDLFAELPVLAGVLITGGILTYRTWPPTGLLWLKIGAGLLAAALGSYCSVMVILRYKHRASPERLIHYRARVVASGIGIPFGVIALLIGLSGVR